MSTQTTAIEHLLRVAADDLTDAEFTAAQARRKRDDLIVDARAAGIPLRRIGELALVSHQTVANIVAQYAGGE
jgi:hypothetical protein